jgi:hypothetical protein
MKYAIAFVAPKGNALNLFSEAIPSEIKVLSRQKRRKIFVVESSRSAQDLQTEMGEEWKVEAEKSKKKLL